MRTKERRRGMRNYEVYLGYACNRACRFCFVEEKARRLFAKPPPFREVCAGMLGARGKGFNSLALLGGEPTLYPGLPKLIRTAKKLGFRRVIMFSNGLRLADRGFARELADAGLDSAALNIPSHRPEIFASLTGQPGGFALLQRALLNLAELALPATAVCVITSENAADLAGYASFYAARGIRAFTLQHMKLQGRINPSTASGSRDIANLKIRMSECVPSIIEMTGRCLDIGVAPPFIEFLPPCLLPGYESRLMEFGRARTASKDDFECWHPGSGREKTYAVAYKDRVKFPACAACVYSAGCLGVDANYAGVFGKSEFRPVKKRPKPFYLGLRGRKRRLALAGFEESCARG